MFMSRLPISLITVPNGLRQNGADWTYHFSLCILFSKPLKPSQQDLATYQAQMERVYQHFPAWIRELSGRSISLQILPLATQPDTVTGVYKSPAFKLRAGQSSDQQLWDGLFSPP